MTATISADVQICNGTSTPLTTTVQQAAGPVTYSWSPTAGLSCSTCANPIVSPATTTTYTVTISDGTTTLPKSVTVTVAPRPVVSILNGSNITVDYATPTSLTATGAAQYKWWPGNYLNTTSGATVISTPLDNITYIVVGTDANGCYDTASIGVNVRQPVLGIPNAFTPNGDGLNEYFHVVNTNPAVRVYTMIFNRWGEQVYRSFNDTRGWDGTLHGAPAALGVYAYLITIIYPDGTQKQFKGNVTLLR